MAIINITKNTIISHSYKKCYSVWQHARGLMFTLKPKCLVFVLRKEQKISLHMWFVFYPIDVIFLDNNKEVIETIEKFMPFSFYSSKTKCRYIIELPQGSIKNSNTWIGDKVEFH